MIALPVAAHSTSSKDSSPAIALAPPDLMMDGGEWPSLGASHGRQQEPEPAVDGDDWEMLSPADSSGAATNEEQEVVLTSMPKPMPLTRRSSISAPDLRELEEKAIAAEADADVSSSVVMVSNPASVAAASSSVVMVSNPWTAKNKVSFRDAILSPSKVAATPNPTTKTATVPRVKAKVKSRYVVTPIKRCAKSTGDLLALAEEDGEDEEVMGESDAMEYYQRKAHGAHGRSNGLKQRPDEAKRKEMIVQKKNLQRQKQGK